MSVFVRKILVCIWNLSQFFQYLWKFSRGNWYNAGEIQRFTVAQVEGSSPLGGGLINRLLKTQLCK